MKSLFLALATILSASAQANTQQWAVRDQAHPLWDVLDVKPKSVGTGLEEKAVDRIKCTRATKNGKVSLTNCKFPTDLKPVEVMAFYKKLKVKPIDTNGAYTTLKVVDRLVVVGDEETNMEYNNARLFVDHACRKVTNGKTAAACMDFWATKILPSFNDDNQAETVAATKDKKDRAKLIMGWFMGKESKPAVEKIEAADHLAVMGEYQDETHVFYFALKNGENAFPEELAEFNVVDVALSDLGDAIRTVAKEDLPQWFKDIGEILFLGLKPDTLAYAWEEIQENLSAAREQQQ